QQRDARRAVGVVLDRGDLRGHGVLLALEVDDAVAALVPAALVPCRDPPPVVAAALLRQLRGQRLLRLALRDLLERRNGHAPPTCGSGLVPTDGHQVLSKSLERSEESNPARGKCAAFFAAECAAFSRLNSAEELDRVAVPK